MISRKENEVITAEKRSVDENDRALLLLLGSIGSKFDEVIALLKTISAKSKPASVKKTEVDQY